MPTYIETVAAILTLVFVSGILAQASNRFLSARLQVRKYREAVALETTAAQEESLVEYIEKQLVAASARQELVVATSGARADRLANAGFILMLSSVLIPFALVYLYISLDPPSATAGIPGQRDWHLLLAGVSFGLLFIAAARGILTAEVRQREVYGREVREVGYYGDLRRALGIAQRLDKKRGDESEAVTEEVVRKIMALLLEPDRSVPLSATPEAPASPGEHEFLKIVSDVVKPKSG